MIAYEIQLRYVIREKSEKKIQYKTKSSLRQNSVQEKIREEKFSDNFFFQGEGFFFLFVGLRYINWNFSDRRLQKKKKLSEVLK